MDSGDRFRRFEEEFLNASRNVGRLMQQLRAANGNVDVVIAVSVDIESELAECEGFLKAMEVEAKGISIASGGDRKMSQGKIIEYSGEVRRLFETFKADKAAAESAALKSGASSSRAKAVANNAKLDKSTRTLENTRMVIAETEGIGNEIIGDMENQKEQLQGAVSNVQQTRHFTLDAKSMLRSMGRRAVLHKILVYLTILILFALICTVIYYGFIKGK